MTGLSRELVETPDILQVGMLADACRRRRHGARVTYVRVAPYPIDAVPAADATQATEIRLTGSAASLSAAVTAIEAARQIFRRKDNLIFALQALRQGFSHLHCFCLLWNGGTRGEPRTRLKTLRNP